MLQSSQSVFSPRRPLNLALNKAIGVPAGFCCCSFIFLFHYLKENLYAIQYITGRLLKAVVYLVYPFGIEKGESVPCDALAQTLGQWFKESPLLTYVECFLKPIA